MTPGRVFGFDLASCGWYEETDGVITRVELRRTDDPTKMYEQHRFPGATVEEADAAYGVWLDKRAEVVARGAARRARWGPAELQDDGLDRVGAALRECERTRRQHPALTRWVENGHPAIESDDQHRAVFGCGYEQKPRRVS